MITNKDVFAKRRAGKIDEAYRMASQLMNNPRPEDWDIKAFAWCIIDLIKRDATAGNQQNLLQYKQQLEATKIDPNDDILNAQRIYALKLCNPNYKLILKAKSLSKSSRHQEAANIYWQILNGGDYSEDIQIGLSWELYRIAKSLIDQDPPNFGEAKKYLNKYLKLNVPKPSLLHTCFLQVADRMAKDGKLSMGVFVRIWGLDNLRPEDYESFITDDGKSYPSLAERVIQHASKDAFVRNSVEDLNYIFPFINDCITKYPDNIWLKLSKARTLIKLGRNDEALSFGLEVIKSKVNDYWAWDLLGDIQQTISEETALSCYCKALLCSKDINFVGKVKIKLAEQLASRNDYPRAKCEIVEVVNYRNNNNQKISNLMRFLTSQAWYESTEPCSSNLQFYIDHAKQAEELLYSDLPWINGILGKCFTIESNSNKSKRIIYIQPLDDQSGIPFEVSVPETKISITEAKHGTGVRIKGEYSNKKFQIYTVEKRDSSSDWDICKEHVGVVDHVNNSKKVIHFIVNQNINSVVSFSALDGEYREGGAIAVRISKYISKQGTRYRTLTAQKTNKAIPESLLKGFKDVVREKNCMGFTDNGIFIPPPLIRAFNIKNGDTVSGMAILNYNKKRFEWGWKAININTVNEKIDE